MNARERKVNQGMDDLIQSLKPFEALMKEIGRKRMNENDFKIVELQYKALKEFIKSQKV